MNELFNFILGLQKKKVKKEVIKGKKSTEIRKSLICFHNLGVDWFKGGKLW